MSEEKVRENKIRRKLKRMGFILKKSRARDPQARGYGGYAIIDEDLGIIVAGATRWVFDMSLDDVEAHIQELEEPDEIVEMEMDMDHRFEIAFNKLIIAIQNEVETLGRKATYKKWQSAWDGEQSELVRACYPTKTIYRRMLRVLLGHS